MSHIFTLQIERTASFSPNIFPASLFLHALPRGKTTQCSLSSLVGWGGGMEQGRVVHKEKGSCQKGK